MSEPEISHRCTSCGASHRGYARFCPQCGAPLTQPRESSPAQENSGSPTSHVEGDKPAAPELDEAKAVVAPASVPQQKKTDSGNDKTSQRRPANQAANPARGSQGKPVNERKPGRESHSRDGRAEDRSSGSRSDKARRNIQRATAAARDVVGDNVRPRVEKIRHASSVVLEEASEDPSLRFILVAGLLFLVFIVLLVISKVI